MDIEKEVFEDAEDALPKEFEHMSADAINNRSRLLENEIRVLKDEMTRLNLDQNSYKEKVKENKEKIKLNNQLPYLVGNIVEVLDIKPEEEEEEDGATADLDSQRQGKCVVLKTSTRQTIFLPVVGLVDANALRPGVFCVVPGTCGRSCACRDVGPARSWCWASTACPLSACQPHRLAAAGAGRGEGVRRIGGTLPGLCWPASRPLPAFVRRDGGRHTQPISCADGVPACASPEPLSCTPSPQVTLLV